MLNSFYDDDSTLHDRDSAGDREISVGTFEYRRHLLRSGTYLCCLLWDRLHAGQTPVSTGDLHSTGYCYSSFFRLQTFSGKSRKGRLFRERF